MGLGGCVACLECLGIVCRGWGLGSVSSLLKKQLCAQGLLTKNDCFRGIVRSRTNLVNFKHNIIIKIFPGVLGVWIVEGLPGPPDVGDFNVLVQTNPNNNLKN